MTTAEKKAEPAAKKPAKADAKSWLNNMPSFEQMAAKTTFPDARQGALFHFETTPRQTGGKLFICDVKITEKAHSPRGVLVRLPAALEERINKEASGSTAASLVALAEWALNRLDTDKLTLQAKNI